MFGLSKKEKEVKAASDREFRRLYLVKGKGVISLFLNGLISKQQYKERMNVLAKEYKQKRDWNDPTLRQCLYQAGIAIHRKAA